MVPRNLCSVVLLVLVAANIPLRGALLLSGDKLEQPDTLPIKAGSSDVTLTPTFTISFDASSNSECREMATNISYKRDLCNAPTPDSYMVSHKTLYSCENRCGQTLPYNKDGVRECACDAQCVAHDDCCRDFSEICPDVYKTGTMRYAYLSGSSPVCWNGHQQFKNCPGQAATYTVHESIYTVPSMEFFRFVYKPPPLRRRTLGEWSGSISVFSAVDRADGIVYLNNYYLYCNGAGAQPFFIPLLAQVECSRFETETLGLIEKLPWCKTKFLKEAATPFHRSCRLDLRLLCRCPNGQTHIDHLHNTCLGVNNSIPRLSRHILWSYQREPELNFPSYTTCYLLKTDVWNTFMKGESLLISISPSPSSTNRGISPQTKLNKDAVIKTESEKSAGLLLSEEDEFVRFGSKNSTEISSNAEANFVSPVESAIDKVKNEDIQFVVEITGTIERRLLCTSLDSFIDTCRLLDCARGYFLSHNPEVYNTFGGSSCLKISQITFNSSKYNNAPICWCMAMVKLLNDINMWHVGIKTLGSACVVSLSKLQTEEPPLEAYENAWQGKWPEPSTKWTPSFKQLFETLGVLGQSSNRYAEAFCVELVEIPSVCITLAGDEKVNVFGQPCGVSPRQDVHHIFNKGQRLFYSFTCFLSTFVFFFTTCWVLAKSL